jgi:hypothetical protein
MQASTRSPYDSHEHCFSTRLRAARPSARRRSSCSTSSAIAAASDSASPAGTITPSLRFRDQLACPHVIRDDDWKPGGHGLERCETEGVLDRRKHEEVGAAHRSARATLQSRAKPADVLGHSPHDLGADHRTDRAGARQDDRGACGPPAECLLPFGERSVRRSGKPRARGAAVSLPRPAGGSRRAQSLDPRRLDRHERRVPARHPRSRPDAEICFDPWHVCRLASRTADVRRDEWKAHVLPVDVVNG